MTEQNDAAQAATKEIHKAFELSYAADADDPANATELSHFANGWRACIMSKLRAEGVQAGKVAGHSEVARCTAPSMRKNHVDCEVPTIYQDSNHGDFSTAGFRNLLSGRTSRCLDIRIDDMRSRHELPFRSPNAQMDNIPITGSRGCDAINGTNAMHDNSAVQHNWSFVIWRTAAPLRVKGDISLLVPQAGRNTYWYARELECLAMKELQASAPVAAPSDETLRLAGVIADKIEDGTLFQAGIYSRRELADRVRAAVAAPPTNN